MEANSPNREETSADTAEGRFPYKVYEMLEDKAMTPYARWHQSGDFYGFFVPDTNAFATYVLPKYFQGETQSSTQAFYVHWNNKFRSGRPELLPEVIPKPDRVKTSTRQGAVQRQLDSAPDVRGTGSQPLSLLELQARISRLENEITESRQVIDQLKRENDELRDENDELRDENDELKDEVRELRDRQSVSEGRLGNVETQLQELTRSFAATSIGGGLSNSVGHHGSGVMAYNNNFQTNGAVNPSSILNGLPFQSQIGANGGGASQHVPLRAENGAPYDTINPALLGPPFHAQSRGFDSATNRGISLSHSGGHTTHGGPVPQTFWVTTAQQSSPNTIPPVYPSSVNQQTSVPATGAPSFAHNTLPVMYTNPFPVRSQASNSPGASGRREPLAMGAYQVPPPARPSG
ncbi:hypothetical protein FS837_011272 [Tulasnella sp. UAMH 9824]|nr:hypothetical protein FS837_011272 [Tulasnella sp. UAMH 9824]